LSRNGGFLIHGWKIKLVSFLHLGYLFSEHSFFFLFHQGILIWHIPIFSAPNVQTTIVQVAQFDASSSVPPSWLLCLLKKGNNIMQPVFNILYRESFTLDSPVNGKLLLVFQ
jgi:hypothetical protein